MPKEVYDKRGGKTKEPPSLESFVKKVKYKIKKASADRLLKDDSSTEKVGGVRN
jgi:hypothetical protein